MFMKNVWYAAAHAADLRQGAVLGRKIASQPVVLCRRTDGSLFALEDRCAHRLAPLSLGHLVGENLQCGYHGATFNSEGRCVRIPGQDTIPGDITVRTYPVIEKYGMVWLWPGDPDRRSNTESFPEFLKYGLPEYDPVDGQMLSFGAHYQLIVDNLLDATHAQFVHRSSFGSDDWQETREAIEKTTRQDRHEFKFDVREDRINYTILLKDTRPGPCYYRAYAMKAGLDSYHGRMDLYLYVNWAPPSLFCFAQVAKPVGAPLEEGIGLVNLHFLTPETETTTHYFYRSSYYFADHNPALRDYWSKTSSLAFAEDKRIIEAQQKLVGSVPLFSHTLIHFDGDRIHLEGRNIVARMYERERDGNKALQESVER